MAPGPSTAPSLSMTLREAEACHDVLLIKLEESDEMGIKAFDQAELRALFAHRLKGSTDKERDGELLAIVQSLTSWHLLRTHKSERLLSWSTRPKSIAKALRALGDEERTVYTYVEDSQEKGVWTREIKRKANFQGNTVEKALKKLEGTKLVRGIRNVKHPMQKTYILHHIVPSDDITGGTFFDAGTLDNNMIEELSNIIIFHVFQNSWQELKVPLKVRDPSLHILTDTATSKKRKRTIDIEDLSEDVPKLKRRIRNSHESDTQSCIVYPAGKHTYPTTETIHAFIAETGILRDKGANMTSNDLQNVIDVLVWDNKLERIAGGYRTVRGVRARMPGESYIPEEGLGDEGMRGNALTQTPCWRCPVADICAPGGPVNADECVYFDEWLGVND